MINIISKSLVSEHVSGPQKVVRNLIKGLDRIGYPYCVNKSLTATSELWIHDDKEAIAEAAKAGLRAIVGPNVFPDDFPQAGDLSKFVYLHPSKWSGEFWIHFGQQRCEFDYWPAGIDTDEHAPSAQSAAKKDSVLIYFKQRFPEELEAAESVLKEKNIPYQKIVYGNYRHPDYIESLKKTKYIIWIGRQESQGLALEEALAMDIPILVWDVKSFGHVLADERETARYTKEQLAYPHATSAYYFDDTCGVKIKDQSELRAAVERMEKDLRAYRPREYIMKNLGLEKQARDLVRLFETHFGLTYEDGKMETVRDSRSWKNAGIGFRMKTRLKDTIKKILKKY